MNYHYTHLGAVPAVAQRSAERRDAMLARTGPAARQILKQIKKLPRRKQVAAMDRVLGRFDPDLPQRVRLVAHHLQSEGMGTNEAVERALALSLADASISKIKQIGVAYRTGTMIPVGALGQDTDGETAEEKSAGKAIGRMFQGIVCSSDLQRSVTEMVGRKEGQDAHDAANLGYGVAQGVAQCGMPSSETPPAAPDSDEAASDRSSLLGPVSVGLGALLVVGGVVWYTRKKS